MILRRKDGWQCFRIFKRRISNGELLGCFQLRSYIDVTTTSEYIGWWGRRINVNIPGPSQEDSQPTGKHLRVVSFELEIIRQDFERRNLELEKKIEQMEEEKMNLRLDMDEAQMRNETLEKSLSESRNEKGELKARVAKLEKTLYQYRNHNSAMEIRASLDRI
ncbi:hypothetical protein Gotri_025209, partial [Gossypium trilobum]|nr:hypothetical protein [Gossypium trilobum]